jgi:hypothetical protein
VKDFSSIIIANNPIPLGRATCGFPALLSSLVSNISAFVASSYRHIQNCSSQLACFCLGRVTASRCVPNSSSPANPIITFQIVVAALLLPYIHRALPALSLLATAIGFSRLIVEIDRAGTAVSRRDSCEQAPTYFVDRS